MALVLFIWSLDPCMPFKPFYYLFYYIPKKMFRCAGRGNRNRKCIACFPSLYLFIDLKGTEYQSYGTINDEPESSAESGCDDNSILKAFSRGGLLTVSYCFFLGSFPFFHVLYFVISLFIIALFSNLSLYIYMRWRIGSDTASRAEQVIMESMEAEPGTVTFAAFCALATSLLQMHVFCVIILWIVRSGMLAFPKA